MNLIKISIIIPNYNGALLLERCLNSVYSQKGDFDLEVIVIDDGSSDNSLEVLEQYNKQLIILKQSNQGPAVARNKGIEAATGKYLAFLDADDYWKPEFLEKTVGFMQRHSEAIAVNTAQLHKIPGRQDVVSPSFITENNTVFPKAEIIKNFYDFWGTHNHVCTGSVLIKTNIVKETGGQLKQLRISQDLEFWSYLATFGTWGFIPKILFVSDGGKVTKKRGWLKKNTIRWKATPSIEVFTQRTLTKIKQKEKEAYNKVIGWVAYNFTYGHIMAKDYNSAYNNVRLYGKDFPESKGASFINMCHKFGKTGFVLLLSIFRKLQIARHYLFTLKA